jgi:putative transposase
MQLVEQHILKTTKELDDICFASKNLYNSCLYLTRQYFFETQKYIGYKRLYEQIKVEDCYRVLPIKVSQLVVKQMQDDFVSFFKASVEYKINPSKFLARPNIPHYKDKENGRNIVKYNNQAFSKKLLKEHIINPSGTTLQIKTNKENINEVRIIPHSGYTCIEVVYTQQEENLNLNKENNIAIDLGVNNLASITSNKQGFQPLLVNGRVLKSINQFYNKTKSKMQSVLPGNKEFSKAMETLTIKRNRKIKHYMHNVSKMIIQLCKDNDIGTIIIGKNDFWKQESNMGKKNNQNFVSIPFNMLIEQLKYKGGLVGITVLYVEESYTSKCSFLDEEEMCHHDKYLGRRVKRGLFKSSSKKLINADTNGSYNIMRKVFPNFYQEYGIEGFVVSPSLRTPCRA